MPDSQDKVREELLKLHDLCADDLREFKSRQWQVTNYALLAYGGLAVVGKEIAEGLSIAERAAAILVAIAALIVAVFAWHTLKGLQQAIELRRDRLKNVRATFTAAYMHALMPDDERGKEPALGMFGTLVWAGFGVFVLYASFQSFTATPGSFTKSVMNAHALHCT